MRLGEKIDLAGEILKFASEKSQKYYQKPLVFVKNKDIKSEIIEDLIKTFLSDNEYEVVDSFVNRRLCICDGVEAFRVKGQTKDYYYTFAHTKEVFKEAKNDEVWDCILVTAMRNKANTTVNPICMFTEQDIEEYDRGLKAMV